MSFTDWVKNGWLVALRSSKQEIANLLGIVARDLKDSQSDGRFGRLPIRGPEIPCLTLKEGFW